MIINDGGLAFPRQTEKGMNGDVLVYSQPGMSFRQYAAVHLLAALLVKPIGAYDAAVADAVDLADLLIMELDKP
jgi:hypothetical protein